MKKPLLVRPSTSLKLTFSSYTWKAPRTFRTHPGLPSHLLQDRHKSLPDRPEGLKYVSNLHYSDSCSEFFAPWVSWCLKRQRGSNGKTFLWLCGFCSKNTLRSWMPQACKWGGLSLHLTLRNTLDAISPVTPTKTQLSPGTKSSKSIICVL